MPRHCFTYGSLMCDDIMSAVCGVPPGRLAFRPAHLPGFTRHPVRNEHYPGMTPSAGGSVPGIVYLDIPPTAWPRLDSFEGEMYERRTVLLPDPEGSELQADTYIIRAEFTHLLEAGTWDFEAFLREGKAEFAGRYLGFTRL